MRIWTHSFLRILELPRGQFSWSLQMSSYPFCVVPSAGGTENSFLCSYRSGLSSSTLLTSFNFSLHICLLFVYQLLSITILKYGCCTLVLGCFLESWTGLSFQCCGPKVIISSRVRDFKLQHLPSEISS